MTGYFKNTGLTAPKEFVTNYNPESLNLDYFYTSSPVYYRYPVTLCTQPPNVIENCE